jgi:uracil-DNA glycosylase family 4
MDQPTLVDPRATRPECASCPRHGSNYVFVPDEVREAALVVVGEAPGKTEMDKGAPFLGTSGKILFSMLHAGAALDRSEVAVANVVKCGAPSNPTPEPPEIACCAGLLEATIAAAKPKVALAVGGTAIARMVGRRPVGSWRGSVVNRNASVVVGQAVTLSGEPYKSGPKKGTPKPVKADVTVAQAADALPVVLTYHPAELARSGFKEYPLAIADVRRAGELATGASLIETGRAIETNVSAARFAEALAGTSKCALDLETAGFTGKIELIGVALDGDVALSGRWTDETKEVFDKVLAEPGRTLVGHNFGFDAKHLLRNGVNVGTRIWDTMHAAHFDRSDLPKALDDACSRMPRHRYYNWKEAFRSGSNPDGMLYNALDCAWTYRLHEYLQGRLRTSGGLDHFENVVMGCLPALIEMELTGTQIDVEKRAELAEKQTKRVAELVEEWELLTGGVDRNSPKQLQGYFYGTLGIKVQRNRKTGAPTLDAKTLESLFEKCPDQPALRTLRRIRHVEKILTTYLAGDLDETGRLHPQFNLSGTVFGRLSGGGDEGFNFQNIPKSKAKCPAGDPGCQCYRLRELFIADLDDACMTVGDWSQIEFRISAILAGQKDLIESFRDPTFDIHGAVAKRLGIPRDRAKRVVHGSNYDMGKKTLAYHVGCSVAEADKFLNAFRQAYPDLARWRAELVAHARKFGWVANPFGRRAYFRAKDGDVDPPKVISFVPQSTAADMMLEALVRARCAGLKLRFSVHDELGVSARELLDRTVLEQVMQSPYDRLGGWWCPADVGVGRTWAEAKH